MALTEETFEIEIKVKCKYSYNGKELDITNIENLESNIKDNVLQSIYNSVESELWGDVGEDLDVKNEDFEIEIKRGDNEDDN